MNVRDSPTLHLQRNLSKETSLLFLFFISVTVGSSTMNIKSNQCLTTKLCEVTYCTIVRSLPVPLWGHFLYHCEMYLIYHYVVKFVSDLWQILIFFPDTPDSPINKTDHHNRIEILVIHMSPPFFIELPVRSHESERSCICVLEISFCLCLHELSIKFCNCSDNVIFFSILWLYNFQFYDTLA
jgi:hypothetical protein